MKSDYQPGAVVLIIATLITLNLLLWGVIGVGYALVIILGAL